MTVKLSSLKSDSKKEREGDWIPAEDIDCEDPSKPVEFLVRSTNYPPFKIARDVAMKKLVREAKGKPVPSEVSGKMLGELAAEHLLLDWKGIDTPFSPDLALEILTDDEYRNFRGSIYLAATKVGQGEVEFVEDTTKNSGTPSVTN